MSDYLEVEKDNIVTAQFALGKAIQELEKKEVDSEKAKNLINVARKALFFSETEKE